ncbi:L,D-transpeptidase family protein, partial [candidate division KSB1 bacterium]|nr:L,D-transpeptidase family protein [candidate division KSB1 bacterium]
YQVAVKKIGNAGHEVRAAMNSFYARRSRWRGWVEGTVNWSIENNDIIILVDKLAHRCYVYENGIRLAEYPIELGPHWLGHKRQMGDGATPEGRYYIRKKKSDKQTVYYKALEIDYPNPEDEALFYAAQQRGAISRHARIGGLIEIHGEGGRGANWTAGCVALRNQDMDSLFVLAKIGTPVTIVGSMRGIDIQPATNAPVTLGAQ